MSLDAKKEDTLERKVKIMALSVILGILSFFISIVAIGIAIYSHVMMKSIANLEYDEKLAIMASHKEGIKSNKSSVFIERIKNDFSAVSNLKFADSRKKEELIDNYIIPILETVLNDGEVSGAVAIPLKEIIDIALKYNIANDKIKSLKQKLREESKSTGEYIIKP